MPRSHLDDLKGKEVEVRATGLTYRGVLLEITTEGVTLRRKTGFAFIPMDRIIAIRDPKAKEPRASASYVDPSFYTADENPEDSSG